MTRIFGALRTARTVVADERPYTAEVAALIGFAVVQPVLDVMGRAPDFFLYRDADRRDIILLAVAVVVVPLALVMAVGVASRAAGPRARRMVHVITLAALFCILAVHVLKSTTPLRHEVLVLAGAALGVGAVVAHLRSSGLRRWVRYGAPAPLVFAGLFLFSSPTAVLVTSGETASALAGVEARAPVVMIVFDEFPLLNLIDKTGAIDERLYPNFAALAEEATWYRNATAVTGRTPMALPSLLTGRFPPGEPRAPHVAYFRENLFTLLGGSYRLHVEETVTRLCPTNLCDGERTVGGGGLRSLLGDAARTWRAVVSPHTAAADPANDVGVLEDPEQNTVDHEGAPDREDTQFAMSDPGLDEPPTFLRSFLDEIDSDGRTLHFAHVLFPHVPWRFLPGGQTYAPIPISRYWGPKLHDQEWPFTVDRHRQVMQTIYTDSLLGATLQQLRETGVYDRALVVVTADHGLNFLPGSAQPWKNLTEENPAQLMWVPLLVKAPGQDAGSVDDRNVMLIDVLPTIADILNVDIPWKVDGTSALGNPRKDPTKLFWSKENQKSPSTVDGLAWLLIIKRGFTDHFLEPDGGEQGLYRVGELGHLVGTSPSAYPTGIAHTAARIDQADQFNDVDRKRDIPALVTGSLDGRPPAGVEGIVIALNGTIAGTSAIFPLGEEEHAFATLVAPSLLKSGSNRVELFVVERSDGELRLSPSRVPL